MALPFTDAQRAQIRARLFKSAQRYALSPGVKKTSLEMLTADAGISKSSFYKFYDSKEQLFWEVAARWETEVLSAAADALDRHAGMSSKARAAAFVFAAFESIHQMGAARFMREDLPYLNEFLPQNEARTHRLNSARNIFDSLRRAQIRFTAPDETVLSVIQLMYLSILSIEELGERFFPALWELVQGACDRLVA